MILWLELWHRIHEGPPSRISGDFYCRHFFKKSSRPICSDVPLCNFSIFLISVFFFYLYNIDYCPCEALYDISALKRCYVNKENKLTVDYFSLSMAICIAQNNNNNDNLYHCFLIMKLNNVGNLCVTVCEHSYSLNVPIKGEEITESTHFGEIEGL